MNWIAFSIGLWLVAGFEYGLRSALNLGDSPIAPSFLMVYLVFVCLFVRAGACVGVGVAVGLVIDLLREIERESSGVGIVVVGPGVFAAMVAATLVLNMRGIVYRKNTPTVVVLSFVGSALAFVIAASILVVRSFYDDIRLPGEHQFLVAIGSALYTAVAAIPLGFVLLSCRRLFGFERDSRTGFRME